MRLWGVLCLRLSLEFEFSGRVLGFGLDNDQNLISGFRVLGLGLRVVGFWETESAWLRVERPCRAAPHAWRVQVQYYGGQTCCP